MNIQTFIIETLIVLASPEVCIDQPSTTCEAVLDAKQRLCKTEDSVQCIWKDMVQADGHGDGRDFIALMYWDEPTQTIKDVLFFNDGTHIIFDN